MKIPDAALQQQRARSAMARFHLRIGQADTADRNDYWTIPLFPLPLILDADGTLAGDAHRSILGLSSAVEKQEVHRSHHRARERA